MLEIGGNTLVRVYKYKDELRVSQEKRNRGVQGNRLSLLLPTGKLDDGKVSIVF